MDGKNPFDSPRAELLESLPRANETSLYSLGAVGLATLLGSSLAGAYLLDKNLRVLGRGRERAVMWAFAVSLCALILASSFALRGHMLAQFLSMLQVVFILLFAHYRIGPALASHAQEGGPRHSNWRAAGIGLLFGVTLLLAIWIPVLMMLMSRP